MENLLDKYRLHPFGGYARDFAPGEFDRRVAEQRARWDSLTPEQRRIAERQYEDKYPRTSNQDGR